MGWYWIGILEDRVVEIVGRGIDEIGRWKVRWEWEVLMMEM